MTSHVAWTTARPDRLLTSPEVAAMFRVEVHSVSRWASRKLLPSITTPGGRYRRYWESDIRALLIEGATP
jgi:DNA-binding transcriptional MerR regulator